MGATRHEHQKEVMDDYGNFRRRTGLVQDYWKVTKLGFCDAMRQIICSRWRIFFEWTR